MHHWSLVVCPSLLMSANPEDAGVVVRVVRRVDTTIRFGHYVKASRGAGAHPHDEVIGGKRPAGRLIVSWGVGEVFPEMSECCLAGRPRIEVSTRNRRDRPLGRSIRGTGWIARRAARTGADVFNST